MAIIEPIYNKPNGDDASKLVTWSSLANGDTGDVAQLSWFERLTVQVFGTFGLSGAVELEGSLDGVNWETLTRNDGSVLNFTTAGLAEVLQTPVFVRPNVTAGDGTTALSVLLFANSPLSHNRK